MNLPQKSQPQKLRRCGGAVSATLLSNLVSVTETMLWLRLLLKHEPKQWPRPNLVTEPKHWPLQPPGWEMQSCTYFLSPSLNPLSFTICVGEILPPWRRLPMSTVNGSCYYLHNCPFDSYHSLQETFNKERKYKTSVKTGVYIWIHHPNTI